MAKGLLLENGDLVLRDGGLACGPVDAQSGKLIAELGKGELSLNPLAGYGLTAQMKRRLEPQELQDGLEQALRADGFDTVLVTMRADGVEVEVARA